MTVERWDGESGSWDALVAKSVNGTFLHTRRYLGYHGARFTDASLVVRDGQGRLVGVLPAALDPLDSARVISHPGLTYGGLVHDGSVRGEDVLSALSDAAAVWRAAGASRVRYKAVPLIYHRVPALDDVYALFRLGAKHARCDLSTTLDLDGELPRNRNRRRNIEKAERLGLRVKTGIQHLATFWPILTTNLQERFGVAPVHSVDEITLLAELFPEAIGCQLILIEDEPVGGVVLFRTERVVHPQYSAASKRGREVFALDAGFQAGIDDARAAGARYYDFGVSTEDEGRVLNTSLYQFKTSFGGGGTTYDQYEVDLG
jgi:hypothetical protein